MSYGRVYSSSTVRTLKDCSSISGEGSVRSNDLDTARSLASSLGDTVRNSNEIAYEAHLKSKGWSR